MISEGEIFVRVLVAALLGAVIGVEREISNQPAGMRTHIVLVTGAALAMTLSINLSMQFSGSAPGGDPARLAAQVLSGIGFLGAGAILRFGATIKGLTTAASLWTMAVVGLATGAGYFGIAGGVTALLLVVLTLINLLEDRYINPNVTVEFTIVIEDEPGVVPKIRAILQENSRALEAFRLRHHVRHQRFRVDAIVRLRRNDDVEALQQKLSELKGVKIVRYF